MKNILLVGPGVMGIEYTRSLRELGLSPCAFGRDMESAKNYESQTGIPVVTGDLVEYVRKASPRFDAAIVAVTEDQLGKVCLQLVEGGMPEVLVEKPGAIDFEELALLNNQANKAGCKVYVAYNRRFYASALAARKVIREDGGVTSFSFDFTERGHRMVGANKPPKIKEEWFFHNSSHVVDMAFFLGGYPKEMHSVSEGKSSWHSRGMRFAGSGVSKGGAVFSYHSNWEGPGRWSMEVVTPKHKFFFKPLEKLSVQTLESFEVKEHPIDDSLDQRHKPGIFRQTEAFVTGDRGDLLTLQEQVDCTPIYQTILSGGAYRADR